MEFTQAKRTQTSIASDSSASIPIATWTEAPPDESAYVEGEAGSPPRKLAALLIAFSLIILASITIRLLFPTAIRFSIAPAASFLILIVLQMRAKRARERDQALLDDPEDPTAVLVTMQAYRNGVLMNQDRGVAAIDDFTLSFSGHRTAFCIGSADFTPRDGPTKPVYLEHVKGVLEFSLRHPEADILMTMQPLSHRTSSISSFVETTKDVPSYGDFIAAAKRLPSAFKPPDLQRVFPPLTKAAPRRKPGITPSAFAFLILPCLASGAFIYWLTKDMDKFLMMTITMGFSLFLIFLSMQTLGYFKSKS